ncbi:MAG: T9SS C-terminal target domain-containing protein, partial [Bacteroidota bacterium]
MKTTKTLLIITLFFSLLNIQAQVSKGNCRSFSENTKNTKGISDGCIAGSSSAYLDLNNVRAMIHTGGDMWWDLQGEASYEVPKGSGKMSLFAGGIWIGGVDLNGQLRSCFVRYRSSGVDYWPGPLITSGQDQANVTADVCNLFDRHFVITRTEVEKFRIWFRAKQEGNTELLESNEYAGYSPPKIIEEWPAHGDILAGQGYDHYLAPFYDNNGDEEYNPDDGDYPFYDLDGELPCITSREQKTSRLYGDQTLWWVFNDGGNVHMESNGTAIGLEIRAQAFCFAAGNELDYMTFGNYELINRSSFTINETYFGVWTAADLGSPWDDYIGCDVSRGLGYLYNGDDMDGSGFGISYGAQPPAIGIDFLKGPYQDPDGLDNISNWVPDSGILDCSRAPLSEGSINGQNFEDGIIDNERWGMYSFFYYCCHGGCPITDIHYYNCLRSIWIDGSSMTFGGSGYGSSVPTVYMFPGSPTSDECGMGTGGVPMGDWSEESVGNTPSDRLFVQSTGPFTLEPGAVNDITYGVIWARAPMGGAKASVTALQHADDKAQKLFESCFQIIEGPDAPELEIIELDRKLILQIYNKKGSNNYKNIPEDYYEKDPFIVCPFNEPDCDAYYRFEGYQVFQMKDKDASFSDIEDIEKAKLVFQCDIENYDNAGVPIGTLINYEYNNAFNTMEPVCKVEGKNEGIQHSIFITEDMFAVGDKKLVNHKKYYYLAIAYSSNNYKTYISSDIGWIDGQKEPYKVSQKSFNGSIKSYEAIPHITLPANTGTILNSQYGDSPEISLLEGKGNGPMEIELSEETVNRIMAGYPWKVDSIGYKKGNGPINIKVVDPLNVPEKAFYLGFDSILLTSTRKSKILRAKWKMWVADELNPDTIFSDGWVSQFTGRRTTNTNEQLIAEYGFSVSIGQVDFPLDGTDNNTHVNDGFITASIEYTDKSKSWLYFVPDADECSVYDWIKSGKTEEMGCIACNDYTKPVNDSKEDYENILFRTWAPYMLANK